MSTVRQSVAFVANEVKQNLLQGRNEERLTFPSVIKIYASATPVSAVKLDVQIGNVSIAKDLEPGLKAAGLLAIPDDQLVSTVGRAGDLVQITARETAGGVATLNFQVEISELA